MTPEQRTEARKAAVDALYEARDSGMVMDQAAEAVMYAVQPFIEAYVAAERDAAVTELADRDKRLAEIRAKLHDPECPGCDGLSDDIRAILDGPTPPEPTP